MTTHTSTVAAQILHEI